MMCYIIAYQNLKNPGRCIVLLKSNAQTSLRRKADFRKNQRRIRGKGVGLGLFPSASLASQSYE